MNQLKNSIEDLADTAAPLFASSWVALYILLREGLPSRNRETTPLAESPKSRQDSGRH